MLYRALNHEGLLPASEVAMKNSSFRMLTENKGKMSNKNNSSIYSKGSEKILRQKEKKKKKEKASNQSQKGKRTKKKPARSACSSELK